MWKVVWSVSFKEPKHCRCMQVTHVPILYFFFISEKLVPWCWYHVPATKMQPNLRSYACFASDSSLSIATFSAQPELVQGADAHLNMTCRRYAL